MRRKVFLSLTITPTHFSLSHTQAQNESPVLTLTREIISHTFGLISCGDLIYIDTSGPVPYVPYVPYVTPPHNPPVVVRGSHRFGLMFDKWFSAIHHLCFNFKKLHFHNFSVFQFHSLINALPQLIQKNKIIISDVKRWSRCPGKAPAQEALHRSATKDYFK